MIVSRRHRKDIYKTQVVRSASSIRHDAWNKVFPDVLEGHGFFKTLDEYPPEQFAFYYILVYHQKELVGIAPCFMVDYALDTSVTGILRQISNRIKKIRPRIFDLKALVCGSPVGEGRLGIAGDRDKVMKAIMRKLEQLARKERAAVIAFKDFGAAYDGILGALQKDGFRKLGSLPTAVMDIRFKDLEDYLKTLSYKTRYDLRHKFRKADHAAKIQFGMTAHPDEATLADIYSLYLQVVYKHEIGFEVLPLDFFRNITKNMPGKASYFLWKMDGKLVAFSLSLISKDTLIGYYIGFDYALAYDYHLYFVKFRDILKWCIEHGIKRYETGYTSYEPKKRLKFDLVPLYLYVKLRNRVLRPAFNLLCLMLKFENFDPTLKEMKRKRTAR